MTRARARLATIAVAAITIAACGGDGGGMPADAAVDATPQPGTFTVSGTVRYEDRPPLTSGALGPITPVVARGVRVAIVDEATGAMLAQGYTADDGTYALTFDGLGGAPIHVTVATVASGGARPVRVLRTNDQIHGFGGATFATATTTHDVLVTEASGEAAAFNVFDVMLDAVDFVSALGVTPAAIDVYWQDGSNDGTYYDGDIHLLGASDDDDGYDDTVILHEAGHYIEYAIGRSDSPGGFHDGSPTDPNLAWSEGFATYFAMAVRDLPYYMDSNAGGGWSFEADSSVTVTPAPGGDQAQDVSEDMINEILWDIGDAGVTDDDPHAGAHDVVVGIQSEYLVSATLRTGPTHEAGVDLVDFLDGFFVLQTLAPCAALRSIVDGARMFPYDFAGPAGACP